MKKKSLVLTLTAVVLALAVGIGGTIAYFTFTTDNVVNTFTTGNVAIILDEAAVKFENDVWTADNTAARVQQNTYSNVYPGASLPKDPTIHVSAGSQQAWVAMKVVVTKGTEWAAIYEALNLDSLEEIVKGYEEAKWTKLSQTEVNGNIEYVFAYVNKVSAGDDVTLFTSVDIPADLTSDQMTSISGFTMTATAYAVQAQGVDFETAKTAFAALAAK